MFDTSEKTSHQLPYRIQMHNLWCNKIETQNQEQISSFFSYVMRGALARFEHRKTGSVGGYLYLIVSITV